MPNDNAVKTDVKPTVESKSPFVITAEIKKTVASVFQSVDNSAGLLKVGGEAKTSYLQTDFTTVIDGMALNLPFSTQLKKADTEDMSEAEKAEAQKKIKTDVADNRLAIFNPANDKIEESHDFRESVLMYLTAKYIAPSADDFLLIRTMLSLSEKLSPEDMAGLFESVGSRTLGKQNVSADKCEKVKAFPLADILAMMKLHDKIIKAMFGIEESSKVKGRMGDKPASDLKSRFQSTGKGENQRKRDNAGTPEKTGSEAIDLSKLNPEDRAKLESVMASIQEANAKRKAEARVAVEQREAARKAEADRKAEEDDRKVREMAARNPVKRNGKK